MIKQIIVTLITIPIRALFLWIFSGLEFELERVLRALFTTFFIFTVFLVLSLIKFEGFHTSSFAGFFQSWSFKAPFTFIVLKLVYKTDWIPLLFATLLWMVIQIPIDILQSKIYGLLF